MLSRVAAAKLCGVDIADAAAPTAAVYLPLPEMSDTNTDIFWIIRKTTQPDMHVSVNIADEMQQIRSGSG